MSPTSYRTAPPRADSYGPQSEQQTYYNICQARQRNLGAGDPGPQVKRRGRPRRLLPERCVDELVRVGLREIDLAGIQLFVE